MTPHPIRVPLGSIPGITTIALCALAADIPAVVKAVLRLNPGN